MCDAGAVTGLGKQQNRDRSKIFAKLLSLQRDLLNPWATRLNVVQG